MDPIRTEFITLNKCDQFQNRQLIAIDSGSSLTKILFLNKNDREQFLNKEEKSITLEFSLFRNVDFEEALERIKLHAYRKEDDNLKIHITGSFAISNKEKIKSVLEKDVVYIDEFMTINTGIKTALEQIGIENMIVKEVDVEDIGQIETKLFIKLWNYWRTKLKKTENSLYPCLFHVHGSLSGCFYFNENGIGQFFGLINEGGKNFLGLAKCILDTNDYNEIVNLASRGNLNNVDTLLKDLFQDSATPYGNMNLEIPLFAFGKLEDYNKDHGEFSKEDLALSLIMLHTNHVVSFCYSICLIKKISKVYIIGNIFSAEIFHKTLKRIQKIRPNPIEIVLLNFGYFGVLGSLMCEENGKEE